ncbi:MAG: UDP-N-acetylglucosamine--N-acetylmuramyl-(pentapeptide) pyrophosphoryl-undecaprenol N-acetylglucosamine transferase [Candidatus Pacebacteria bacterium]|nr:UDP-N-acetylglucosamine--N-acetylmuramyl-(pentapeptide) pyrophosphoryl-undecaprenol N-acetylglucosamine transferase [Candidatus Paceibacterota bacterium]PIR60707.1 MAG: hypothetical protein COU67_01095 [Candidatus Pacebacteria bacterium CG10_big_fil_rev_8_21_14_0_10_44_54]
MKILTTGGHLTPALAFIDYVREQAGAEFIFLGREFSQIQNNQRSQEIQAIATDRSIPFIAFQSGKLTFHSPWQLLLQSWQVIIGIIRAFKIISTEKPDVVVLFGGYLAVPVALAAWLQHIPVVTHEQTAVASLSTQIIGIFSKKIAVSHKHLLEKFSEKKVVFTGNLLRHKLENNQPKKPSWLGSLELPVMYITGGNQGSQVINATIAQVLPQLTRDWTVVHQCGSPTKKTNYAQQLHDAASQLSHPAQARYSVREWITETELAWLYTHAQIVISRAGANTLFELQHFGLPAILIPLPFSHQQEQLRNAEIAAKSGNSIILPQNKLNPDSLITAIKNLATHRSARRKKNLRQKTNTQGNKNLWNIVSSLAKAV